MDKARLEIRPGVWLDYRRCAYLEEARVLAVSDLHLGYAWAHRFQGQMMPLMPDGVAERLLELCAFYQPSSIAVLGDVVHRAVPVAEVREDVTQLIRRLREHCGVQLILGNHDKGLRTLFPADDRIEFHDAIRAGGCLLVHGNERVGEVSEAFTIMGHEHPAISLGDGVRSAKFPCFLQSEKLLVLPAFSRWAAGSDIRSHEMMSPLARETRFERAVAILNGKLLPVRLS